jgi:predicted Ser/Thr protein kinase
MAETSTDPAWPHSAPKKPATEDPTLGNAGLSRDLAPTLPREAGAIPPNTTFHCDIATDPSPGVPGYEVLEELGRGGMGVVYLARQAGLNRLVALKMIIRADFASEYALRRFEAEAQVFAKLHHPNIVQIHEAGISGRVPYFCLEYVEGGSLDRVVRKEPLTSRAAAALVEKLARAVHYAHGQGVVHRDLKPQNVLLTKDGEPKITDFGTAKRIDVKLTGTLDQLGTPSYMAPEQAGGRNQEVGPATDVYALGAILYECLTGVPPFRGASVMEVLDRVRQEEPLAVRELRPGTPLDLQTICHKCLRKEPNQRYASADALADDLRRFLEGKPIAARPVGRLERTLKWSRRYPQAVALIVVTIGGALVALGLAAWALHAKEQAAKALAQVAKERDQKEAARAAAQARLDQLNQANQILADVFRDLDPQRTENPNESLAVILGRRLTSAAEQLRGRAVGDPLVVADLQNTLGKSLLSLGYHAEAIPILRESAESRRKLLGPENPATLTSLHNLASAQHSAGRFQDAIELFETVHAIQLKTLPSHHPDALSTLKSLAAVYASAGKFDLAIPRLLQISEYEASALGAEAPATLGTLTVLASSYQNAGQSERAAALFEQVYQAKVRTLGADDPRTLTTLAMHAGALQAMGKDQEALALLEKVREPLTKALGADHPDVLITLNNLALAYHAAGRMESAAQLYEQVHAAKVRKLGPEHPSTLHTMVNLAEVYKSAGQASRALEVLEQIHAAMLRSLGPSHPSLLIAQNNLATAYRDAEQLDKAATLYLQNAVALEQMGFQHQNAAGIIANVASCQEALGQYAEAEGWRRKWLAVLRDRGQGDTSAHARELTLLGLNLLEQRKHAEAEQHLRASLAYRQKNEANNWNTFSTRSALGEALAGQKKDAEAESLLLAAFEGLRQREPEIPAASRFRVAEALERLVHFYETRGAKEAAAQWRQELEKRNKQQPGATPSRLPPS